jgi:hypothetical protein
MLYGGRALLTEGSVMKVLKMISFFRTGCLATQLMKSDSPCLRASKKTSSPNDDDNNKWVHKIKQIENGFVLFVCSTYVQ